MHEMHEIEAVLLADGVWHGVSERSFVIYTKDDGPDHEVFHFRDSCGRSVAGPVTSILARRFAARPPKPRSEWPVPRNFQ